LTIFSAHASHSASFEPAVTCALTRRTFWPRFEESTAANLSEKTFRAALNVLSTVDPSWVAANVDPSWFLKYARRFGYPRETLSKDDIEASVEDIGRDGMVLLEKVWRGDSQSYLRSLPAIETLRKCWILACPPQQDKHEGTKRTSPASRIRCNRARALRQDQNHPDRRSPRKGSPGGNHNL
jgi:hypothetical protein